MIEMTVAAESQSAPAESDRELFERLSVLIGRTLAMGFFSMGGKMTIVAKLESVEFDERQDQTTVTFSPLSGRDSNSRYARRSSTYRVLSDGLWKTVHDPKATKEVGP